MVMLLLQNDRLKFVTEGSKELGVDGLLDLVQSNQTSGEQLELLEIPSWIPPKLTYAG